MACLQANTCAHTQKHTSAHQYTYMHAYAYHITPVTSQQSEHMHNLACVHTRRQTRQGTLTLTRPRTRFLCLRETIPHPQMYTSPCNFHSLVFFGGGTPTPLHAPKYGAVSSLAKTPTQVRVWEIHVFVSTWTERAACTRDHHHQARTVSAAHPSHGKTPPFIDYVLMGLFLTSPARAELEGWTDRQTDRRNMYGWRERTIQTPICRY